MPYRLAIIQSHPIQYFSPWFRVLASRPELELKVFYCLQPTPKQQGESFGVKFEWDVPLLEGYAHEFLPNRAREPGLRFFGCNTPKVRDLVAARLFDAWLIPGWNLKSYWQAMRACWRYRIPMLVRGDSNLLAPRPLHVRLAKRLVLGCWIPRFSACLTVGKLAEEFYRFYGADASRLFPVRHFVDNDFFEKGAAKASKNLQGLRRRWQIPEDALTFILCGKLVDVKRPLDFLLALGQLTPTKRPVHALIVGDGPLRAACESFARAKQLPVTFAGFLNQSEIVEAYACSDALVLPSSSETWGLVVNEAMACGRPAIVSDKVGCGPDLVKSHVTGYVFPAGNVASLSACMSKVVRNPATLDRLSYHAKQRVQTYSLGNAVEGLMKAVNFLAKGNAIPAER